MKSPGAPWFLTEIKNFDWILFRWTKIHIKNFSQVRFEKFVFYSTLLMVYIVWCSEGPCDPSNENQFTNLDPEPLEIDHRATDFT